MIKNISDLDITKGLVIYAFDSKAYVFLNGERLSQMCSFGFNWKKGEAPTFKSERYIFDEPTYQEFVERQLRPNLTEQTEKQNRQPLLS
jgi:hypothetical protein